jgi:hypothetical protein
MKFINLFRRKPFVAVFSVFARLWTIGNKRKTQVFCFYCRQFLRNAVSTLFLVIKNQTEGFYFHELMYINRLFHTKYFIQVNIVNSNPTDYGTYPQYSVGLPSSAYQKTQKQDSMSYAIYTIKFFWFPRFLLSSLDDSCLENIHGILQ